MKKLVVYLMASKSNGTLYVGVTSNLAKRCWQHKSGYMDGFTKKYQIHLLVYYEIHRTIRAAIAREKQIKKWKRAWKIRIIEERNPFWIDLYEEIKI
jgi:putative endonuclease